jgi:hypothetical protein
MDCKFSSARYGKREEKRASLAFYAFSPYPPAVRFDDMPGDR